ncbi:hypothetical protein [Streptomyces sp. NBC_00576]|uniref:hypothetical protein n=1 Tax=Streptomyces sp. NBC_00576 TaxID=2903665 RepID=UPI002E8247BE|nr:hypothetical protein [Streptomyces sp. NBC_00576]WUB73791.1 hypothetical protein OG734_29055 [Streptomyces sp. NBC_00576]
MRDGIILLFVALLEGSLILGGKLHTAWAITVSILYVISLASYARGLVRRRC